MKNAFIAIALVLVASTAFAALDSQTKNRLHKINSDAFGKTILETIQVELKSKDDPRPRIVSLLNELEQETLAEQAADDAAHENAVAAHAESIQSKNEELASLEANLEAWEADQDSWETELSQTESLLELQTNLLALLTSELDDATTTREANQATWEGQDNKLGKDLDVFGQVKTIITQRLANRYNSEFLQTAHKEILSGFVQVKETINSKAYKKASPGFARLAAFIAAKVENTLSQEPTAEDEEAEAQLTSVVNILEGIIEGLLEAREQLRAENERQQNDFDAKSADLSQQISTAKGYIDNLDTSVTDLTGRLNAVAADIETATDRVAELNQQIIDEDASAANAEAKYQDASSARTSQLSLLQEVLDIVQNQLSGLRQYAEDYIGSH